MSKQAKLEELRAKLLGIMGDLDAINAPSGIRDHLDSAVNRLDSFHELLRRWEGDDNSGVTGT